MTNNKDTASFFENGSTEQFEFCFKKYPEVLKLKAEKRCKKPQELIRLDDWYQNELPKLIKARGKDAHMVYDELVQTMKWKQTRGKFYPQLSYLVKVNTPRAVMQETKKAFRKLPNLEQAITALSNLKGVGTTMASALLAAAAPDKAPFMADECLMAIPEIEGIDYTTKEYLNFVQHIQTTVDRLNSEVGGDTLHWSPHRVELALWAHYVANDLNPDLLDEMPGPGSGGGAKFNGNAKAKGNGDAGITDGNEDTNDDDESLGVAGRVDVNNTTTDTETENENTNPAPLASVSVLQDGDSNFVSNDSTSQEPIIDDNTTQTTATTSTDDGDVGDVGTPLASDSESNLEAPQRKAIAKSATGVSATGPVAPLLPVNSSSKVNMSAVGNGNGSLLGVGAGDSLDGENSSCRQSSSANDDGASEDYEDRMIDDSSNSNSNSRTGQKSVTPIINLNDGTNTNDNDSTLSSSGISIGQKRSLHCGGSGEGVDAAIHSQPDVKKIRNE